MTPMVCPSSMTPEFTSPTSITVMAEEDWMAMVMPAPSRRLREGVGGHALEEPFQPAAGHFFQTFGHGRHAVEEESQAAAEGEDEKKYP